MLDFGVHKQRVNMGHEIDYNDLDLISTNFDVKSIISIFFNILQA